ncbi:MAG: hypothetical protein PHY99_01770, partial [Bacteroidales bacterium]|nr:hypothetical protein [Bacteroidales bacterium]
LLILSVALALSCSPVFGQSGSTPVPIKSNSDISTNDTWGFGINAGLNGFGLELVKGFGDRLTGRLGYSWLKFPYSRRLDLEGYDLVADAKITLGGSMIAADYRLANPRFHLTGGIVFNQMQVLATVRSRSSFPYGVIQIPAEEVGTITGQLRPGINISPYLAAGITDTLPGRCPLILNVEAGFFYQGAPTIQLSGEGVIGPMASQENTDVINKIMARYPLYPMINFRLTYFWPSTGKLISDR